MDYRDKELIIKRYKERYRDYGYSPRSLGWVRNNQEVRFKALTSLYDFSEKKILDIGCGFGDLIEYFEKRYSGFSYTGIDLVEEFISEAKKKYYKKPYVHLLIANILEFFPNELFDFAVGSGLFNYKLSYTDNYCFIEEVISKTLSIVKDGVAFDFLSDRVDFYKENLFYNSAEKIISIAYKFSKRFILRNDYMPFEFCLYIFKNEEYNKLTLEYTDLKL